MAFDISIPLKLDIIVVTFDGGNLRMTRREYKNNNSLRKTHDRDMPISLSALLFDLQAAWLLLQQTIFLFPLPSSTVHHHFLLTIDEALGWLREEKVDKAEKCLSCSIVFAQQCEYLAPEIRDSMMRLRRCYQELSTHLFLVETA